MKLKEIKQILDGLTDEELEQEGIYLSDDRERYESIDNLEKASEDLYRNEDASLMLNKGEIKRLNYDVNEWEVSIKEGDWYFLI
jgi:hypothetical protein